MAVDASIYQGLKQFEGPSVLDSATKAVNLSGLAMQQKRMGQQIENEDREAKLQAHMKKATAIGGELEALAGLPEQARATAYSQAQQKLLKAGIISPEEASEPYDPGLFRQSLIQYRQTNDYLAKQKTKAEIHKLYADARGNGGLSGLTPGQKMADTSFAKDAADYYYGGGRGTVEKNFQKLEDSINTLTEKPDLTGGLSTKLPWLGEDAQQDWVNPNLAAVRDDIRGAIQGSLKQILGGQFTEKEATSMFNRAFNPRLSAQENTRRAQAELEALRSMASDKDGAMRYFEEKGTLVGFKPAKTNLVAGQDREQGQPKRRGGSGGWMGNTEANAAPAPIKHGTVEDGFVFMGGDPADQKNWKKER